MSDMGIHSNLYQRTREYADLVDEVLVRLKSGTSSPADASRRRLATLLGGLGSTSTFDLSTAWLGLVVGGAEADEREEWRKVGDALLGSRIGSDVIERLQELACLLENQRTDALAKMRGVRG